MRRHLRSYPQPSKIKYNTLCSSRLLFQSHNLLTVPCCKKLLQLSLLTFVHWVTRKIWGKKKSMQTAVTFFFPNSVELNSVSERLFVKYIVRCCSFPCETGSPLTNIRGVFVLCCAKCLWWVAVIGQMKNGGSAPNS